MKFLMTLRAGALVVQALLALLVGVVAGAVAFIPHCAFAALPRGVSGLGLSQCDTFPNRGGVTFLLLGLAALGAASAVVLVAAAARPRERIVAALVVQLLLGCAATILGVAWLTASSRPASLWIALCGLTLATVFVVGVTSTRVRTSRTA
jgi:hypothetical protein